ncbi:unnamed protein product, partial [Mycena citricolor]
LHSHYSGPYFSDPGSILTRLGNPRAVKELLIGFESRQTPELHGLYKITADTTPHPYPGLPPHWRRGTNVSTDPNHEETAEQAEPGKQSPTVSVSKAQRKCGDSPGQGGGKAQQRGGELPLISHSRRGADVRTDPGQEETAAQAEAGESDL